MLWALYYVDHPNSTDLRMSLRPDHLAYLKENNGMIVVAGATLSDDGETMTGSVIIIDAPDRAAAEAFSANDPFAKGNLFSKIEVKRMRKGIWNPDVMPDA